MLTVNECYKSFVIDKLAVTEWHNYFVIECFTFAMECLNRMNWFFKDPVKSRLKTLRVIDPHGYTPTNFETHKFLRL